MEPVHILNGGVFVGIADHTDQKEGESCQRQHGRRDVQGGGGRGHLNEVKSTAIVSTSLALAIHHARVSFSVQPNGHASLLCAGVAFSSYNMEIKSVQNILPELGSWE